MENKIIITICYYDRVQLCAVFVFVFSFPACPSSSAWRAKYTGKRNDAPGVVKCTSAVVSKPGKSRSFPYDSAGRKYNWNRARTGHFWTRMAFRKPITRARVASSVYRLFQPPSDHCGRNNRVQFIFRSAMFDKTWVYDTYNANGDVLRLNFVK